MLSDTQIRAAKPGAEPIRLHDDRGLYLEVTPAGGKWWRFRYPFDGKDGLLSMGTYPDTSLKAARERRDKARSMIEAGVDPSQARRAESPAGRSPYSTVSRPSRANGTQSSIWLR